MSEPIPPPVDWPAFLRRHDLLFDALPQSWQEAPHFGNALVGSMLYQVGNTLRLQVFRADVHDHRDERHGWTAYSRPRFMIGHFALHPRGTLTGCSWRKDLWNAELTGTIATDRGEIRIRHFVHADDMAIVTELTPSGGERHFRWTWHPVEARTTRPGYPTNPREREAFAKRYGRHHLETLVPFEPNPPGRLDKEGAVSSWVQDLLAGGQYATAWAEQEADGVFTHFASVANSYPDAVAARTATADVRRFLALDRGPWVATHRAWWHEYYPRSFVTIPDKGLEALYWQTIYRLGGTSRTGRGYVDTSGLWFQGGPWPYTTNDWNTQSAHWGVYAANRLEQGGEIVNRLHRHRDNLVGAVHPEAWQADSAYLHLATAGDLAGGRRGDMRYYDCVGCLPWLLNNAWWQYRYSMDEAILRETVYPLLRRAVNLYLHLVEEGDDGKLHLSPTYSPETGAWKDCNFDLSLLKWGCHVLLKAARRLDIDDPLAPRWREVVERLVDFPADENGFRLGAEKTAPPDHRHLSHLLMIYPLHLVHIDQEGAKEVLERSYRFAHDSAGTETGGITVSLHGMVQTHAGPIGAVLGDGDRVLEGLRRLQGELHPNGLWGDPPCIESTLGLANNIQAMLLQSWSDPAADQPGPIRVFPALPSSWADVEFHDLRAEGAFLVSAKRTGGRTEWVKIRSLAGEPCRVRPGLEGEVRVSGPRAMKPIERAPGLFELDLRKGEEVVLCGGCGSG